MERKPKETNYERYFGNPLKVSEVQITHYYNSMTAEFECVVVQWGAYPENEIEFPGVPEFFTWLNQEADDE